MSGVETPRGPGSTPPVERLAVVGLGLLGGSVALAARRRGAAHCVVGATRRADVRERALAERPKIEELIRALALPLQRERSRHGRRN